MLTDMSAACAGAIGIVFAMSAGEKLRRPKHFISGVNEYGLIPKSIVPTVALTIMVLESIVTATHLTSWFQPLGSLVALVLITAFTVSALIVLRSGREVRCQCFGVDGETVSPRTLARLGLLFFAEATVIARAGWFDNEFIGKPLVFASTEDVVLWAGWSVLFVLAGSWVLRSVDLVGVLKPCEGCRGVA